MTITNGLEINVNDKLNFHLEGNRNQVWQVLKIDEANKTAFIAKVGKNGKLLKPGPANMKNVNFSWLAYGYELGDVQVA